MIERKDIEEAWDRLARDRCVPGDGALIWADLKQETKNLMGEPDPSDSALRADFGRRTLAHEKMALMAKGIDDSDRRTSSIPASERPITAASAGPVAVSRRESVRDRIARTDPELTAGTDD